MFLIIGAVNSLSFTYQLVLTESSGFWHSKPRLQPTVPRLFSHTDVLSTHLYFTSTFLAFSSFPERLTEPRKGTLNTNLLGMIHPEAYQCKRGGGQACWRQSEQGASCPLQAATRIPYITTLRKLLSSLSLETVFIELNLQHPLPRSLLGDCSSVPNPSDYWADDQPHPKVV